MLLALQDEESYGMVLRSKGVLAGEGCWYEFDYVPGEPEVRERKEAETTGMICVIGVGLKEKEIKELFGV